MSSQRPERASKTKAAETISAMIAQPLPALNGDEDGLRDFSLTSKLLLKFTKDIWNSYAPSPPSSPSEKAAGQKRKRKPSPVKTEDEPTAKAPKRAPPVRRQCKVKLTRFHYGGPDRREGGKYRDMITLETPCLQPTCANCWKWHAHLMRGSSGIDEIPDRSEKCLSSPPIGPMSLSNKWQPHQSRRDSTNDVPGVTIPLAATGQEVDPPPPTPVHHVSPPSNKTAHLPPRLTPAKNTAHQIPAPTAKYHILPPNPILQHTTSTPAKPRATWRPTPRKRYTATLPSTSEKSKAESTALAHKQLARETRVERHCPRGMTKEAVRRTLLEGQGDNERWPRRRQRLRLKFRTDWARSEYRSLVEGCL